MSDVRTLEAASYATWTADERDVVAGWHVTATAGLSRRVNSARDLGDAVVDDAALASLTAWFAARELPLVVRETPIMSPQTSAAVRELWGLDTLDETPVMARSATTGSSSGVRVVRSDDSDFQEDLYALNGRVDGNAATLHRIYARVADRSAGLWIPGIGAAVVALAESCAAVFSLAVAQDDRRKGVGSKLMATASDWAVDRGASEVFVQVSGTNTPAIELYGSLGFEEVYRYRYLQAPTNQNEGGP